MPTTLQADTNKVWEYDEYIRVCKALEPRVARKFLNEERRKYCVAPTVFKMRLLNGTLWEADTSESPRAGVVRVSAQVQRSNSDDPLTDEIDTIVDDVNDGRGTADPKDGWGEEHQIVKIVDHCTSTRNARGKFPPFAIYSDAGLSGRLPSDDQHMAQRANELHAVRYERLFKAVWLDESYLRKCKEGQEERHLDYLKDRLAKLRSGYRLDTKANLVATQKRRLHKPFTNFRPGISELLHDLKLHAISEVIATDVSRLSRSMAFLQYMAEEFVAANVVVTGLIQDMSFMSTSTFAADVIKAIFAAMAQYRIDEVLQGYFQGVHEHLMNGRPLAQAPSWIKTNGKQPATIIESRKKIVVRVIEVFMEVTDSSNLEHWRSAGTAATARRLNELGVPILEVRRARKRKDWDASSVDNILCKPALIGLQTFFGGVWETLPRLISDELYRDVQGRLNTKSETHAKRGGQPAEAAYLGTGFIHCICGEPLTHLRYEGLYMCMRKRKGKGEHHVSLHIENLHRFIALYIEENAEAIVATFRDSMEGRQLSEAADRLRTQIERETAALRAAEPQLRKDVEAELPQKFRTPKMIESGVQETQAPIQAQIDAMRRQVREISEILATSPADNDVDDIEGRLARWTSLPEAEKNAVLHTLFKGIYASGDIGQERFTPTLNVGMGGSLTPIPLVSSKCLGRGWARKLPETSAELHDAFLRGLPA